jgi:hypothetical protein
MSDSRDLRPAIARWRMIATVQRVKENLNLKESGVPVNLPDCYIRIAEIVYYKAESRDFEPGHKLDDWFEAEREFMQ